MISISFLYPSRGYHSLVRFKSMPASPWLPFLAKYLCKHCSAVSAPVRKAVPSAAFVQNKYLGVKSLFRTFMSCVGDQAMGGMTGGAVSGLPVT